MITGKIRCALVFLEGKIKMPAPRPTLRVLIADNSPQVLKRLGSMITECQGVQLVGEVQSGGAALESFKQLQPDVVILDVRMPGGGLPLLQQIRAQCLPATVIFISAYAYPQTCAAYLGAGADYFFDKASEFEQVLDVLTALTRQPGSACPA